MHLYYFVPFAGAAKRSWIKKKVTCQMKIVNDEVIGALVKIWES